MTKAERIANCDHLIAYPDPVRIAECDEWQVLPTPVDAQNRDISPLVGKHLLCLKHPPVDQGNGDIVRILDDVIVCNHHAFGGNYNA